MKNLFKPIMAAGVVGLGFLSTQAHATYATFVTSGHCGAPCHTTKVTYKPVKTTRVVTTTVITSTVVSRPRAVSYAKYCPPPKRYSHYVKGHPPRDGRSYYHEPSFIW